MTLVKSVNQATAAPGDTLTYSLLYTSSGTIDAHDAVIVDPVPAATVYVAGSATAGAGTTVTFSHDGGTTFDSSEAAPVTHIRWALPAPLAPGDSGTVAFQARIP